jgi:hypothetical protein
MSRDPAAAGEQRPEARLGAKWIQVRSHADRADHEIILATGFLQPVQRVRRVSGLPEDLSVATDRTE